VGRLTGASVGGAGVELGGAAVVSTGTAVETAVTESAGADVIAWVAVGSGVQVGSSTTAVAVAVITAVSGGVSVRVGMEITG